MQDTSCSFAFRTNMLFLKLRSKLLPFPVPGVVHIGIKVGGMEDLPDAMYLRGSDQRSVEALEANIPNLSRPEVQAYIVR